MAGPATNVATIGSVYRTLGARALAVYLTTIVVGSVGLGMAFDFVLQSSAISAVQHHHESTWWATASAIALLLLVAWFAWRSALGFVRRHHQPSSGQVSRLELSVDGMTCASCAARLERALAHDEAIKTVRVELEPGKAVVSGNVSEARVRELVERAGFTARTRLT
jgi:copper chaperone CopZ